MSALSGSQLRSDGLMFRMRPTALLVLWRCSQWDTVPERSSDGG